MMEPIFALAFVAIVVFVLSLVGHILWVAGAWILRAVFDSDDTPELPPVRDEFCCDKCGRAAQLLQEHCAFCGYRQVAKLLADLSATERTLRRFHYSQQLDELAYSQITDLLATERSRLTNSNPSTTTEPQPTTTNSSAAEHSDQQAEEVTQQPPASVTSFEPSAAEPVTAYVSITEETDNASAEPITPRPVRARRSFSDMLNSFMEESNIRWGEIIGGLLIIGCSTALVVSLWAQISQIPVLKFLIFTTVTAVLFGIGLYTEHRWKLPNTSLGILTIATLLVPLNFLAIAAVSSSTAAGNLVLASEIIAPAVFLTLVYYAGRVITPRCASFLSLGILLSSVGQLLVRHFATAETTGFPLVVLGGIPVICFVVTVGLVLRSVLMRRVMDEPEVRTLFTMLGTIAFASALPFGLLLYKAGPLGMTMMYLAPTVTMWGLPLLLTGVMIWQHVRGSDRVATRTTGATLAILGSVIALAGVVLSWPNPASIVPSTLIAFFVFTAIATTLKLRVGHLIAAICIALAYLVTFHVAAGSVPWTNLRVFSLLNASLSASSGTALVGIYLVFLGASEWLARHGRRVDSTYYQIACGLLAAVSLTLVTLFGVVGPSENYHVWLVYLAYSLGAFWIAWRRRIEVLSWVGSALALFAVAHAFADVVGLSFPWQTAFLVHATLCAVAAIIFHRERIGEIRRPLYYSSLISLFVAVICLFQANPWQVTAMQAERVLWIAGTILLLLWINRRRLLFSSFQVAITVGSILTVKAALQACDWYAYLPHAFLHPTGLLIQGIVLLFVGLAWIALRVLCRSTAQRRIDNNDPAHWTVAAWHLLNARYAFDRVVTWSLLCSFCMLVIYGVASGVTQELAAYGSDYKGYDLAGFPRHEVLGFDSWIVFSLLIVTMLGHALERRSSKYLLGAIVASAAVVPLIAGLFEPQIAVASAWRWLAPAYLAIGSIALWNRQKIADKLTAVGWPAITDGGGVSRRIRTALIALSVAPLVVLTLYPSLRAIYYLPVQGPASGIFALLSIEFSYSIPLIAIALVFVGYSLRERSAPFALIAGVFINAAVTIGYLLSVVTVNGLMDREVLARVVQLNAIASSLFALAWLKYSTHWAAQSKSDKAIRLQTAIPFVLNALLILPGVAALVLWPTDSGVGVRSLGSFPGWLAFATTLAAVAVAIGRKNLKPLHILTGLAAFVCMLAFVLADVNPAMMTGLHSLTVGMIATAWFLFAASKISAETLQKITSRAVDVTDLSNWNRQARGCALLAAVPAIAFSLRPGLQDPASDWWAIICLLSLSALFAVVHNQTWSRRYLLVACFLFNVAGGIWLLSFPPAWFIGITAYIEGTIIILAVSGLACLLLELRSPLAGDQQPQSSIAIHQVTSLIALLAMSVLVLSGLFALSEWSWLLYFPKLGWVALGSVAALLIASLYDRRSKLSVAGLYVVGVVACGLIIQQVTPPAERYCLAVILLAVQGVVASFLWRQRAKVAEICARFGMPPRIVESTTAIHWLPAFNCALVGTATIFALSQILLSDTLGWRLSVAATVVAHALTFALLAQGEKRKAWQCASVGICLVGAVFFGWAWLNPLVANQWLDRFAIVAAEMCLVAALFTLFLTKSRKAASSFSDWSVAVQRFVPWVMGAAAVAMILCLNLEIFDQITFKAVGIQYPTLLTISATFIAAAAMLVFAAVAPTHDPLRLSDRGRMIYVYAAEIMLALCFVHIRLTVPWLFGRFERFWPFIVMGIAYAGLLLSEILRRQQVAVLVHPLERTILFIPLLPALGFWISESDVDYSALLVVVGGLYGLLSLLRRSFTFGVIAGVCANGAFWYFLQRTDNYQFLQHPQFWLVPVALSVLLAAYLNEDDFTEDQMASTRYLALVTIYLSSTADIVINGVANSPWLPLILGVFSLAGIFGGILLRIRGMLLLGSTFLLFAIVTMIWYASENLGWTWLWYVAGIVTGATIIFMFAVFEKKRSDVLRLVEDLRDWER